MMLAAKLEEQLSQQYRNYSGDDNFSLNEFPLGLQTR